MDIREEINKNVNRIRRANESRAQKYKQNLLKQLDENLNKKKQSIADNQGLINRYHGAKPQGLTQMQQAMEAAL